MVGAEILGALATRNHHDLNRRALLSPPAVIQVVKVAGFALVKHSRAAQGQGAIAALAEASCVDGASLRGAVKLELIVGSDIAGSVLCILDDTVRERCHENAGPGASRCPPLRVGRRPDQHESSQQ